MRIGRVTWCLLTRPVLYRKFGIIMDDVMNEWAVIAVNGTTKTTQRLLYLFSVRQTTNLLFFDSMFAAFIDRWRRFCRRAGESATAAEIDAPVRSLILFIKEFLLSGGHRSILPLAVVPFLFYTNITGSPLLYSKFIYIIIKSDHTSLSYTELFYK